MSYFHRFRLESEEEMRRLRASHDKELSRARTQIAELESTIRKLQTSGDESSRRERQALEGKASEIRVLTAEVEARVAEVGRVRAEQEEERKRAGTLLDETVQRMRREIAAVEARAVESMKRGEVCALVRVCDGLTECISPSIYLTITLFQVDQG